MTGLVEASVGGSVALVGGRVIVDFSEYLVPRSEWPSCPSAILVERGLVTLVGSDDEVLARAGEVGARVVRLAGHTVTPGLFDSHSHPLWAARVTMGVDLGGCDSLEKLCARLRETAARLPAEAWLRGWNLEYEAFSGAEPAAELIDEACGGRPALLLFYDLHTGLASSAALAAAGVSGWREFDDASEVVVDGEGVPTGLLREPSAYGLVEEVAPKPGRERLLRALREQFAGFAAVGLTGCAVMDGDFETLDLVAELERRGELLQRVTVHHWHRPDTGDVELERVISVAGVRGRLWRAGAVKLFSDGVVDTGTAWLHSPDACGAGGSAFWPDWDRFAEVVRRYARAGLLLAVHAVGDRAVSDVLDVFEGLPAPVGAAHSIEHLEVMGEADVCKLGRGSVVASMQPLHMQWRAADLSDSWASRLGVSRCGAGFSVRSVLQAGVRLVLGSDWPVAQFDPRVGLAWAIGRRMPGVVGGHVFEPEQCLSNVEALCAYTCWPAAARGHVLRGVLRPGCVGDVTVWDGDPLVVGVDEIVDLPVVLTVVDGRVAFAGADVEV